MASGETPRSIPKALVLFVVAGVAAAAIGGWIYFSLLPEKQDYSDLLTHKVKRASMEITVTADGTLESSNNIEIKCNVKGGSTVLWVIETGTTVKPGDVLVELDRSQIEDNVTQRQISYENALANKIIAESDVKVAQTSITEYLEGTYQETKSEMEKEIFDAEEQVKRARAEMASARRLAGKGIVRGLQLEGQEFAVESAEKDLELKRTKLNSLEKYTKEKQLEELRANLNAAEARLAADNAALALEKQRLEREKEQLENCTIVAPASGLVIFPSMADWKSTPDIEEGAVVREQQTLLMIPDVEKMQVKVGIHESKVDRLSVGMPARIEMQGFDLSGEVQEIAEVTRPAGWWTGNLVEYDTVIKLEKRSGLKPGMSAIVEVVLAQYSDVLSVPVASILETDEGFCCWVRQDNDVEKRIVELGDSDDNFVIVSSGLEAGEEVVLNPLAFVDRSSPNVEAPNEETLQDSEKAARKKRDTAKISKAGSSSTLVRGVVALGAAR